MKKFFFFITTILIVLIIIILNLDTIRSYVVQRLNEEQKQSIREIFFGKGEAKLFQKYKLYGKMNYNQNILPDTHYIDLNFYEKDLSDLDLALSISKWNPGSVQFFLENYEDKVILADSGGNFFYIERESLYQNKKIDFKKIDTNFRYENGLGSIRDLYVHKNKIFISYSDFSDNCTKINIDVSNIDESLKFENFFKSEDCSPEFDAGRINYFNHKGIEGILVTTDTELEGKRAQDINSSFGKILFIDFENKKSKIFSMGHRTPQGLYVEGNTILAAEHGPRGGDEINNIKFNGNYGWPIVSYGEPYYFEEFYDKEISSKNFFYKKNHTKENFIEPIYAFVPSIGINQIIKIPNDFSKFWSNNYLITSLNGRSIYRAILSENNNKVISMEKIFIGKRIRDIVYNKKNNIFILSLEGKKKSKSSDAQPKIGVIQVQD